MKKRVQFSLFEIIVAIIIFVSAIGSVTLMGVGLYVVYHFIAKYW